MHCLPSLSKNLDIHKYCMMCQTMKLYLKIVFKLVLKTVFQVKICNKLDLGSNEIQDSKFFFMTKSFGQQNGPQLSGPPITIRISRYLSRHFLVMLATIYYLHICHLILKSYSVIYFYGSYFPLRQVKWHPFHTRETRTTKNLRIMFL